MGYVHSCTEIYEDKEGHIKKCNYTEEDECENSKCSQQYKIYQTNGTEHMTYIGHYVSCENSTA